MSEKYSIGVDLGGTNLRVALVSADGEVLEKIKGPSSGDVFETLKGAIGSLMGPLGDGAVAGVGIGVAGLIDREGLRVLASPNMPSIEGRGFGELGIGAPVVLENDANAAALGEMWMGAGRQFRSFVLFTLGTGIGGGVIHKGRLLEMASEVGHMSIAADGEKCPCGNTGCLELYCSARAIAGSVVKAIEKGTRSMLRDCCQGNIYRITPEDVYAAAFEGDALAREALKNAGRHLGVGIANMINLMSPDAVVLTGGLTGAWDIYVEEAAREASQRAFRGLFEKVRIVPSALGGDDAGVLGAARLALEGGKWTRGA